MLTADGPLAYGRKVPSQRPPLSRVILRHHNKSQSQPPRQGRPLADVAQRRADRIIGRVEPDSRRPAARGWPRPLPLRAEQLSERAEALLHETEEALSKPHPRLADRIAPRRLVWTVQQLSWRVAHAEGDIIFLCCFHKPNHQLLYIFCFAGLSHSYLMSHHAVALDKQVPPTQLSAKRLKDSNDAEGFPPVDGAKLLNRSEFQHRFGALAVNPCQTASAPVASISARYRCLAQRRWFQGHAVANLQVVEPPLHIAKKASTQLQRLPSSATWVDQATTPVHLHAAEG